MLKLYAYNPTSVFISSNKERSGSMVKCSNLDQGVADIQTSPKALYCVLQQDNLSSANSTGST